MLLQLHCATLYFSPVLSSTTLIFSSILWVVFFTYNIRSRRFYNFARSHTKHRTSVSLNLHTVVIIADILYFKNVNSFSKTVLSNIGFCRIDESHILLSIILVILMQLFSLLQLSSSFWLYRIYCHSDWSDRHDSRHFPLVKKFAIWKFDERHLRSTNLWLPDFPTFWSFPPYTLSSEFLKR
jgi:hypothetical protein